MRARRHTRLRSRYRLALTAAACLLAFAEDVAAQQAPAPNLPPSLGSGAPPAPSAYAGGSFAAKLLGVPVSKLSPGNVPVKPDIPNPMAGKPEALQRGMNYFTAFNCVGCHAPNGGGGMGPSLSNGSFIYGSDPANIYLSIYQGRPNGMPAWGAMLPDSLIWDLVTYIQSISSAPTTGWGQTISRETLSKEQVPAEYLQTATPWSHTQPFSSGQKPSKAKP